MISNPPFPFILSGERVGDEKIVCRSIWRTGSVGSGTLCARCEKVNLDVDLRTPDDDWGFLDAGAVAARFLDRRFMFEDVEGMSELLSSRERSFKDGNGSILARFGFRVALGLIGPSSGRLSDDVRLFLAGESRSSSSDSSMLPLSGKDLDSSWLWFRAANFASFSGERARAIWRMLSGTVNCKRVRLVRSVDMRMR